MFKIALTPCSPAPQTRMYPLRCQSGWGRRRRGRPPDLPRSSRRQRRSWRRAGRAEPGAWVTRCGCQGQGPPVRSRDPDPHSDREGGVRPPRRPSVRRGNWGHISLIAQRTIMSPSARPGRQVSCTRTFISLRVRLRLVIAPGREGRLPSTRRKQVCGGCS